ncbi:pentatricopeptide repeat-containing protein At1g09220, mitochondrial [Silene latifolia]|uniref:pentatricopeptide repeat-containing protein At1g09220, mitochondrial n=1 Tax=Silene latifolia TaxID=37657 RepID=UPI003D774880
MRWLPKQAFIYYVPHLQSFPNFSASISSYNTHTIQDHYYHHLLSKLNDFPSSRRATQQIHSQLTTNGSLNQSPTAQIIFLFNTLLRSYAIGEFPQEAIFLYRQATPALSFRFDSFTYSFLIKSCANMSQQLLGFQFHGIVVRSGFDCHVYVQTALLNMCVDFGLLANAYKVFDEMSERNLVGWNILVTGLVKWGHLEEALTLFRKMPKRNVVSWTSMIDAFTSMNNYQGALTVFREMIVLEGIMPTEVSLLAILKAIANLGDLNNCQVLHAYAEKCGFNPRYIHVTNCHIDTYAKCGCIESASRLFQGIPTNRRNVVTWTSIVAGFAMHGMAKEAKKGFEEMQKLGIRPNRITFLSVLNAYSHGGLAQEGVELFERMVDEGFVRPDLKHYGAVVDMLSRAGRLKEAEEIASRIPNHSDGVVIWRTILGACNVHGQAEVAERVTRKIQEMERGYGGDYVLMSNILTNQGKFSEAEKLRKLIDEKEIYKISGRSFA